MTTPEQKRAWRLANPDKVRAQKQRSYQKNREAIRARQKLNRDPEAEVARAAAWAMANPERYRRGRVAVQQVRRARKRGQFVESVHPLTLWKAHGGCCGICKEYINLDVAWPDQGSLTIDHVKPLSKGGMHGYVNTQPAHRRCNTMKAAA